ncbi:MAG: hypothetical protein H7315_08705 [Herminiimonas sp.]|nr:hypothetical protein [Herminiimonas sp.]
MLSILGESESMTALWSKSSPPPENRYPLHGAPDFTPDLTPDFALKYAETIWRSQG